MATAKTAHIKVVMQAHVPRDGHAAFAAYEAAVLPLLQDYGAALEQRLATADGTRELHVVQFPSEAHFAQFRADPRRSAHAHMLAASGATIEVAVMYDVA